MSTVTTQDGAHIYYKDWGSGQPIVFSHGWPLSADDWDAQMIFFASRGFRCIAHDRRGHGRSTQTWNGNEMDTYADDLVTLTEQLDLQNAIHVGPARGGRGVAVHRPPWRRPGQGPRRQGRSHRRGAAAHAEDSGQSRWAALRGLRRVSHGPAGRSGAALRDIPAGTFFGFNRAGAKVSQGLIDNWWRQGMMCGVKAAYDCIKAFSETDFTEDLKKIDVPTVVMHGDDDQVVPIGASGLLSSKLVKGAQLKVYPGLPHGM